MFGFEHEADARRFLNAVRARLEAFALSLNPDKTRIIEFGRGYPSTPMASAIGDSGGPEPGQEESMPTWFCEARYSYPNPQAEQWAAITGAQLIDRIRVASSYFAGGQ